MASSELKYRCVCKAIKGVDGGPKYSAKWVGAKRASFKVYEDQIACDSWVLPFDEITSATLFKTKQWFIPVEVLKLATKTDSYQFGFNPWAHPTDHMNVPISEQRVRLSYSAFSIAIRVVLVGAVIAYLAI
ncbi:hypothetical protein [Roseovarius aestuarii]|uniref:Uncharacterized protein n=1 Tax=Roseovarius aestuarii TaxID=475083 RepID=A0A1X7BYQ1_9RHOB|nr:hypothetical protein [Roseovarius aestuarii]SMC14713.1 hypothetical protein ROA7745_04583 [Roseovarius aestuarii]